MAATIRQELEEEFLSTIRKGQETALEAARPLAEAVHYVIPAMPAVRVPLAGLLPTAREAVAGGVVIAENTAKKVTSQPPHKMKQARSGSPRGCRRPLAIPQAATTAAAGISQPVSRPRPPSSRRPAARDGTGSAAPGSSWAARTCSGVWSPNLPNPL
jgi:hypothetical protein